MPKNNKKIVIAATFTADPVKETIKYFMERLNICSDILFAPYNQVLQQLLDPNSLFLLNNNGINIILLRFEDWYKYENRAVEIEIKKALVEKNAKEFISTIKKKAESTMTPYLIFLCPSSPIAEIELRDVFANVEKAIENNLSEINHLQIIKQQEINRLYPVKDYYDEHANKLAHLPFTKLYFTSLATVMARKIYAHFYSSYKVVVVDCDNTLWKGICGENDLSEIEISQPYVMFQNFLESKRNEGMLLCICSKNNESDVLEVFEKHKEMILKKESIVSWHCNWKPKSENIRKLSKKIGLSLDSMIFIDDNPLECADVQKHCPEVLTLQFPDDDCKIKSFIDHIWAFERRNVTDEDKERTKFYQMNAIREELQNEFSDYSEFLTGLQVEIILEKASESNISRIHQLVQRTNQFNFTTIRRNENELKEMCLTGNYECYVISAKDRLGDYGMVGVMIFQIKSNEVHMDTLCLSCRALGRNIEHKMLEYVFAYSLERGIENIVIPFIQSNRNEPAFQFLNSIIVSNYTKSKEGNYTYVLPVKKGLLFKDKPVEYLLAQEESAVTTSLSNNINISDQIKTSKFLSYIVSNLNEADKIAEEFKDQIGYNVLENDNYTPPTTPIEIRLTEIWSEYLGLENIGIYDDFFSLGGSSILLMQILSEVEDEYNVDISLDIVYDGDDFTITKLSKEVVRLKLKNVDINQLEKWLKKLDSEESR